MPHLLTLLQALIATLALVFGGGVGAVLLTADAQSGSPSAATVSTPEPGGTPIALPNASPVAAASPIARSEGDLLDGPVQRFEEPEVAFEPDEPLDVPLAGDTSVDGSDVESDVSAEVGAPDDDVGQAQSGDEDVVVDSEPLDDLEQRLQDEPLDAPVLAEESLDDGRAETVEPLDENRSQTDEPADKPRVQVEEPLDAPPVEPEMAEVPPPVEPARPPIVEAADPLDAPLGDDIVQAPPDDEVLDAPISPAPVAVVPAPEIEPAAPPPVTTSPPQQAAPVAPVESAAAPVTAPAKSAPVAAEPAPVAKDQAKPVTSVRSKGATHDPVVVVSGRRPLPSSLADCGVAVGAGRSTVGVNCDDTPVTVAHQPAIPRVPGSAALVSTEDPATITSRRDGIQIGEYADPDLGESIATTVRAAIFPEDVIVPDILIVPGELTVAGNRSREDPIVVWRSELEQAAQETGIPVEMLATVIRVTSNGDPEAASPTGVGLMHVPISELVARGISEDKWVDPATNIRIGAQLLAEGAASPSDVLSGAAVAQYLAGTCGENPECASASTSQVNEWIVYYRLRATTHPAVVATQGDATTNDENWPFSDEIPAPSTDPIGDRQRAKEQAEQEAQRTRNLPTLSAAKPEDEPDWNWPWTPPAEE